MPTIKNIDIKTAIIFLGVALSYFLLGKLGLLAQNINEISVFWPAFGFGLAVFLLLDPIHRAAVFIGMIALSSTDSTPFLIVTSISITQFFSIYLAYKVYKSASGMPEKFGYISDFWQLVIVAGIIGSLSSAILGIFSLVFYNRVLMEDALYDILAWFLGDWLGVVTITPLLISLQSHHKVKISGQKFFEIITFTIIGVFACLVAFQLLPGTINFKYPLIFIPSTLAIWAGIRYGLRGATISNLVITASAFISSVLSLGPYANNSDIYVHFWLALFLILSISTSLFITIALLEIQRKNKKLELTEMRLNQALHVSKIGIWEWDIQKSVIHYDKYWMKKLNKSEKDEYIPLSVVKNQIHPDDRDRFIAKNRKYLKGETEHYLDEFRTKNSDGSWGWIQCKGRITQKDKDGRPLLMIGSNQDISDRKKVESLKDELLKAQNLESLGLMAGGIAHDFNNLLQGIIGHADLARGEVDKISPISHNLDIILQSADSAAALCQQLLAYSGGGQFLINALNLSETVKDMGEILDLSIGQKADVHYDLDGSLPEIHADKAQMQQLVMNLITNAAEACEKINGHILVETGSVTISEPVHMILPDQRVVSFGEYIYLKVEDNGEGISRDIQDKIFEPFFTTKSVGRGLGMAAISGIISGHEAMLALNSNPGEGTTMTVYFAIPKASIKP